MRKLSLPLLIAVWAGAVGGGLWTMLDYELTPAAVDQAPESWPPATTLRLSSSHPTLVMFLHPHCPCSHASVAELADLVSHSAPVDVNLVFLKPPGFADGWEKSDLWQAAAAIPRAMLSCDSKGLEAATFRANTSGETLLYDRDGRLLFHGGFTAVRGHRGENAGRFAVEQMLAGLPAQEQETPVFGCCLHDRQCTLPSSPQQLDTRDPDDATSH